MPYVELYLSGLEPEAYYNVQLSFVTSCKHRNRYDRSTMTLRKTPKTITELNPVTCHPDSPNSGKFWMSKPVSFHYVKITTYEEKRNCHVREINNFLTFPFYYNSYMCLFTDYYASSWL